MTGRSAIDGTAWTVGGYIAMQLFRFGFNVALAQLVAPKTFGIMALVSLFIQGLQMFSDLGIRQCVIQHPRGDEESFLNTAWTVQVIRGAALFLGALVLSWPMAAFYAEPALGWLIPLAGLGAFIAGFSSTSLLTYSREVRRGPLVRRELGVYVVTYTAVLIAVALIRRQWPGSASDNLVLAIITLGMVASALGEVALSFTLGANGPHRFAWDPEARRELLSFGGWVFVSSTCTFLAAQADRLVVGKLSLDLLGVYHIAVVLATLPAGVLVALGIHLVFPLMTAATRDGESLTSAFQRAHRSLIVAAGLLIPATVCLGPLFISLVYNDQYAAAADIIRLVAIAAWFTALLVPGELVLLAQGHTRGLAVAQATRLLCVPALLFGGYFLGGLAGLILGVACGELIRYVIVAGYLSREGIRAYPTDMALTLFAALLLGGYLLVEHVAGSHGAIVPIIGAVAQVLVWVGVYVVWASPYHPPTLLGELIPDGRKAADGVQT
jgi:O-antigen/teichoic acid export membrane protein